MKTIGLIGTGIMGQAMCRNLMKAGFSLQVYNRTKEKADALIEEGAVWKDSPKDCSIGADAIITIVGYPGDVEEVYFGKDGILEGADPGTYLIDMTTSSPQLAQDIYNKAKEKGLFALDAPVTGGDVGAQKGTLSILVGGDQDAFASCQPFFQAMGSKITYMGKAGMGQHTKLANQIVIAGTVSGCVEAMAYAKQVGLDPNTILSALSGGAADSFQLTNTIPRVLREDFAPGFFIKHFVKDMNLAVQESERIELELPVLRKVRELYQTLMGEGYADLGTQGLYLYYDKDEHLV